MNKFINPANVVALTGLTNGQTVSDLGCGGGFYTLPAAQIVGPSGLVYAVDIQDSKLAFTQSIAHQLGYTNINTIQANLEQQVSDVADGSCDLVITASILHEIPHREPVFANAYRMLKTGGKLLVVEWKKGFTVFGPAQQKRIAKEEMEAEVIKLGFRKTEEIPADHFHYALLFIK
jgi:ubiquinone/menaquinone biosynthesis C-methylase UbiE